MAVDTPARIAILGAGPVGLEAALYARYLGYEVDLYEPGQVGERLLQSPQLKLSTLALANRSSLGIAALQAQDENWRPPPSDSVETAAEFVASYCVPLSQTDLLIDSLHLEHLVLKLSVAEQAPSGVESEEAEDDEQCQEDQGIDLAFELTVQTPSGDLKRQNADVVIDCTGGMGIVSPVYDAWRPESPAAHFHVLPEWMDERSAELTPAACREEVRRLFALLGDRESLNLYATFKAGPT